MRVLATRPFEPLLPLFVRTFRVFAAPSTNLLERDNSLVSPPIHNPHPRTFHSMHSASHSPRHHPPFGHRESRTRQASGHRHRLRHRHKFRQRRNHECLLEQQLRRASRTERGDRRRVSAAHARDTSGEWPARRFAAAVAAAVLRDGSSALELPDNVLRGHGQALEAIAVGYAPHESQHASRWRQVLGGCGGSGGSDGGDVDEAGKLPRFVVAARGGGQQAGGGERDDADRRRYAISCRGQVAEIWPRACRGRCRLGRRREGGGGRRQRE